MKMNLPLIWFSKLVLIFSRFSGLGAGSTWPGHLTLAINSSFLREFRKEFKGKIIIIAGTNGKTTTSKIIRTILTASDQKVIHNQAGANLLNGVASAIIESSNLVGKLPKIAIFEVDENTLPLLLENIKPDILLFLNLFRDQLDRYGEVDAVVSKWHKALLSLPKKTEVVLNADDPHIAFIGKGLNTKVSYFGLNNETLYIGSRPHAMDAIYCPNCGKKLEFTGIYFAHLGKWRCNSCKFSRPKPDFTREDRIIPGIYNLYNVQAATLVTKILGVKEEIIKKGLKIFKPAFGRQEEFNVEKKKVKLFLSKNPASFNESLRTIKKLGAKKILLVLNDRIPDGRDVSWIWDVDFEEIAGINNIVISGDRTYDMGLRIKYSTGSSGFQVEEKLGKAIEIALKKTLSKETLFVLPTYSAMLEVRKILTGRKIL